MILLISGRLMRVVVARLAPQEKTLSDASGSQELISDGGFLANKRSPLSLGTYGPITKYTFVCFGVLYDKSLRMAPHGVTPRQLT